MSEAGNRNPTFALGELRGMLAVFAWANHKCNHFCTFTFEELPAGGQLQESLRLYFADRARKVSTCELDDWRRVVSSRLQHWFFQLRDLIKPNMGCSLDDERHQHEIVGVTMEALIAATQPEEV